MSEHPKSMDEFAAGMREAGARGIERGCPWAGGIAAQIRGGEHTLTEVCIAYVREHFKFVEGICFNEPNQDPCQDFTFYERGGCHESMWQEDLRFRTCCLVAKPAPEPKPDAVRKALERIIRGEGAYSRDQLTHAENCIDSMKEDARKALAALDAER